MPHETAKQKAEETKTSKQTEAIIPWRRVEKQKWTTFRKHQYQAILSPQQHDQCDGLYVCIVQGKPC